MKKTGSSKRWLERQKRDIYHKQAQSHALPSRAAFKLKDIHERYHLFSRQRLIIELGASPGGWSKILSQILTKQSGEARLIAIDERPMPFAAPNMLFVQGDIQSSEAQRVLCEILADEKADGVLSDMAPKISGIKDADHHRQMMLCHQALLIAHQHLKKGGFFLTKVTQGEALDEFVANLKSQFKSIRLLKPKASRAQSREQYVLAQDFNRDLKQGFNSHSQMP